MSYGYNIIRNGITIPLTQVFAGYNSGGTTSGFNGMGSFAPKISTANFKKQNPVGFQQNGNDLCNVYQANYVTCNGGQYTGFTIPNNCNKIRVLLIGGGGGSGTDDTEWGGGGGGGGMVCFDLTVSGGNGALLTVGDGGANLGFAGYNGGDTSLSYGGVTYYAYGGKGGFYGNFRTYWGGDGGGYTTGLSGAYSVGYSGGRGSGNIAGSTNPFDANFGAYGDGRGGASGNSYAVGANFDEPFLNVGLGGSRGSGNGNGGNPGYGIVLFLY